MLLTEFDPDLRGVIHPDMIHQQVENFPETVVSIFSWQLFESLRCLLGGRPIAQCNDADGVWPVYEAEYGERRLGFCKARVGAPACIGMLEDVIAMGAKRLILTGNCGVLDRSITDCGIIIPTKAIRDEGTSYHYAPAGDFIDVNTKYRDEFVSILEKFGYSYVQGITWTTDAFYRETQAKVAARRQMGAICVEMECAAVQAMCNLRGVDFFQFLYAGDNLAGPNWDPRSLAGHARLDEKQRIGLLAFELAARIDEAPAGCGEDNDVCR